MYKKWKDHKSFRLQGYDYSQQGDYFITICTKNFAHWFGEIKEDEIILSEVGCIVERCWTNIPNKYPHIELGTFVVMPNHFHGLLCFTDDVVCRNAINRVPTGKGGFAGNMNPMGKANLGEIIRWFKGVTTFYIHKEMDQKDFSWQPRFHDHIIRNKQSYKRIEEYIENNPIKWEHDCYFGKGEW